MTDVPGRHLAPAVVSNELPMGSVLELPDAIIATTLQNAQSALDLMEGNAAVATGVNVPCVVYDPLYKRIHGNGSPTYLRNGSDDKLIIYVTGGYGQTDDYELRMMWAPTKTELNQKLAAKKAFEVQKEEFVAAHPLGNGALVVTNEYGGIDCDNPDETANHLILRTLIAGEAGLETVKDLVRAGLLNHQLGELLGSDIQILMANIGKLVESLALLPEEVVPQVGPAMLLGAATQAKAFIEAHKQEIALTAQVHKDPELFKRVLATFKEVSNIDLEATSSRSGLNTKLAKLVLKRSLLRP